MTSDNQETAYPERAAALRLNTLRVRLAAEVLPLQECRGCDDWEWPAYVPKAERRALILDYHTWNGDPEEAPTRRHLGLGSIKAYLTEALLRHARETVSK